MSRPRAVAAVVLATLLAACSAGAGPEGARPDLDWSWSWAHPDGLSPGAPGVAGDEVAVTWSRQALTLHDRRGRLRWAVRRTGLLEVAPVIAGPVVVAATDDGLAGYDRTSGVLRWQAALGEGPGFPVASGEVVLAGTWEGSLVAVGADDGRVHWRIRLGGPSPGPPAVAGPVAVVTFDDGRVAGATAVEVASGAQRWSVPLPSDGVSAAAVTGDVVVAVAADVAAHGLALADGTGRWRTDLDGAGSPEVPPLALPGGGVLVAHRLGGMARLDGRDGTIVWRSGVSGAAVRGGPAGPGRRGWFALALFDGSMLLAGPERRDSRRSGTGWVRGVARGPGGSLVVAVGRGDDNHIGALRGW